MWAFPSLEHYMETITHCVTLSRGHLSVLKRDGSVAAERRKGICGPEHPGLRSTGCQVSSPSPQSLSAVTALESGAQGSGLWPLDEGENWFSSMENANVGSF